MGSRPFDTHFQFSLQPNNPSRTKKKEDETPQDPVVTGLSSALTAEQVLLNNLRNIENRPPTDPAANFNRMVEAGFVDQQTLTQQQRNLAAAEANKNKVFEKGAWRNLTSREIQDRDAAAAGFDSTSDYLRDRDARAAADRDARDALRAEKQAEKVAEQQRRIAGARESIAATNELRGQQADRDAATRQGYRDSIADAVVRNATGEVREVNRGGMKGSVSVSMADPGNPRESMVNVGTKETPDWQPMNKVTAELQAANDKDAAPGVAAKYYMADLNANRGSAGGPAQDATSAAAGYDVLTDERVVTDAGTRRSAEQQRDNLNTVASMLGGTPAAPRSTTGYFESTPAEDGGTRIAQVGDFRSAPETGEEKAGRAQRGAAAIAAAKDRSEARANASPAPLPTPTLNLPSPPTPPTVRDGVAQGLSTSDLPDSVFQVPGLMSSKEDKVKEAQRKIAEAKRKEEEEEERDRIARELRQSPVASL